MPTTTRKPEKLGNVWASCRIQVIGPDDHWKTVATCVWAPNPIAATVAKLRKAGVRDVLWVYTPFDGRTPIK